jgi:hypothetical protein
MPHKRFVFAIAREMPWYCVVLIFFIVLTSYWIDFDFSVYSAKVGATTNIFCCRYPISKKHRLSYRTKICWSEWLQSDIEKILWYWNSLNDPGFPHNLLRGGRNYDYVLKSACEATQDFLIFVKILAFTQCFFQKRNVWLMLTFQSDIVSSARGSIRSSASLTSEWVPTYAFQLPDNSRKCHDCITDIGVGAHLCLSVGR